MKLMTLFVILMFIGTHKGVLAQQVVLSKKLTLHMENKPLDDVLKKIRKKSHTPIMYILDVLDGTRPVSIHMENAALKEILDSCMKGQGLYYEVLPAYIVIKKKAGMPVGQQLEAALQDIDGWILSERQEPLEGATIAVNGSRQKTTSDEKGHFVLKSIAAGVILKVSCVNYETKEIQVQDNDKILQILLPSTVWNLGEVKLSSGYGELTRDKATGSYDAVDNRQLIRTVDWNLSGRLKDGVSGVLFNPGTDPNAGFLIRGKATLFADPAPLIVLNKFPYDGDINMINPNDIESITILKDAAATSIWGVRASNGVIVITTKKGKPGPPRVLVNTNLYLMEQMNWWARPDMNNDQVIAMERDAFAHGKYDQSIASGYEWVPPVAMILDKRREELIDSANAEQQINLLRGPGLKEDLMKYVYHKRLVKQYYISLSGSDSANNRYFLSVGYNRIPQDIRYANDERITINMANTYSLRKKLELSTGVNFFSGRSSYPDKLINTIRPYQRLVDANGNPASLPLYNKDWLDTIGQGRLLNWTYNPLEEMQNSNNQESLLNYVVSAGLKYKWNERLDIEADYQYGRGTQHTNTLNSLASYFTRNLINSYAVINYTTGEITNPVPMGNSYGYANKEYTSHSARIKAAYNKEWGIHSIALMGGVDLKSYYNKTSAGRYYGYNVENGVMTTVDYNKDYPLIFPLSTAPIAGAPEGGWRADRYFSYYANGSWTIANKYTWSGAVRKDKSNLFGASANQRGQPLWSVGGNWNVDKEAFFRISWIQELRVRASYGYMGNVYKDITSQTTGNTQSYYQNPYGESYISLVNPPNPNIRWEKTGVSNIGVDARLWNDRVNATIDIYRKNSRDLIGTSQAAPSSGFSSYIGNTASLNGHGVDMVLGVQLIRKENLKWMSTLFFNTNKDKVVGYKMETDALGIREGYASSPMFSWKWAGLDHATGDPMGFVDGKASKDWSAILNKKDRNAIVYHGSQIPVYFGSFRNRVSYQKMTLLVNVGYKLGYYFRANSLDNINLLSGAPFNHKDFGIRWQQPGDETRTTVPSIDYTENEARASFYSHSAVLVQPADHIRLQDIQLIYEINRKNAHSMFDNLRVQFTFVDQVILWRKNKKGIDPEYQSTPPQKMYVVGIQAIF